jgi:hypothetical protein
MKTRILNIFIFICSISAISFSQTSESNIASTEIKDSVVTVISDWHGVRIVNPVTVGTETSGFFYYKEYPWIEAYGVSLALYSGHSFSFDKVKRSFAEHSPMKPMRIANTVILSFYLLPGYLYFQKTGSTASISTRNPKP